MRWLKQLFTRCRRYDELSESIREHIDEMVTSGLLCRGMVYSSVCGAWSESGLGAT